MIEHLSYSSINTYLLCPRFWRFRYLNKIEMPTSAALIFGSAFHNTIEDYVRTRSDPNDCAGELTAFWQRHWTAQLEQPIDWGTDTPEEMCNLGVRMFSDPDTIALVDSLKPLVIEEQPRIELRIEATVPSVPVPIIGYVDMIEHDGIPCDFKTSARSWNQDKANSEMQPTFYLAALNQAGYDHNPELRFRHYIFVKTKKPKVQIWESHRTVADLFWLFGLVRDVWHGIEVGVFPPNPGTWKCSPKYCEYWGICRGEQ